MIKKMMEMAKFQQNFQAVLDDVARDQVPYVLTQDSHPSMVIFPYDEFLRLQELYEEKLLTQFGDLLDRMSQQNKLFSEEEVQADIARAIQELADLT